MLTQTALRNKLLQSIIAAERPCVFSVSNRVKTETRKDFLNGERHYKLGRF